MIIIFIFLGEKCSRSDSGSNPRPMATPPSTKCQHFSPLSQITILKKNGSLDSGIQVWYLSTHQVFNSKELLYTMLIKHCFMCYDNCWHADSWSLMITGVIKRLQKPCVFRKVLCLTVSYWFQTFCLLKKWHVFWKLWYKQEAWHSADIVSIQVGGLLATWPRWTLTSVTLKSRSNQKLVFCHVLSFLEVGSPNSL
jgi:hypothetical protein